MSRRSGKKAWDQIEIVGQQGDGTIYRRKGGTATVFYHDKAALDGNELLATLKSMDDNPPAERPSSYSCGLFSEDVGGIRISTINGLSAFVPDEHLTELAVMISRRQRQIRDAEKKIAERRVSELQEQLRKEQAKLDQLK